MKNGPYAVQTHADARSAAFANVGTQAAKHGFNIGPANICSNRCFKNSLARLIVPRHYEMVSVVDIVLQLAAALEQGPEPLGRYELK